MNDQGHARIAIEELLGRGFFAMVYQPIFKDPGAPPYGYEALLRGPVHSPLGSPQRVFHDPGYIPHDLMLRLDLACIGAAVRSGRRLTESAYLFINVHGRTLQGLVSKDHHVYQLIESLHIDPSRIVLEISESTPVKDIKELARHLIALRRQGLRIALDDVGTGFPWLEYLIWLEPNFVKLDRHFVTGISQEEKKQKLVWALGHGAPPRRPVGGRGRGNSGGARNPSEHEHPLGPGPLPRVASSSGGASRKEPCTI